MPAPPPLIPWNGFDLDTDNNFAHACRRVAELLADDDWHPRKETVRVLCAEFMDLQPSTLNGLITSLKAHGDVREHNKRIRLTTRWRHDPRR